MRSGVVVILKIARQYPWPPARRSGGEAERERRAKIVAAEGEYQAAVKLGEAADIITQHPVALQLRTLQTMAEISVEKNSTIIFPAQFMTTVQEAFALLSKDSASKSLRA
jgi:hypothetical protein